MSASRDETSAERFLRLYGRAQADVELLVERDVLGAEVGATGYTTLEEATALGQRLALGPGSRLLELGSGRGWPGLHLAKQSGCRIVLTDVPAGAPHESLASAVRSGVRERAVAAAADGAALPFRARAFGAVSHADVLC